MNHKYGSCEVLLFSLVNQHITDPETVLSLSVINNEMKYTGITDLSRNIELKQKCSHRSILRFQMEINQFYPETRHDILLYIYRIQSISGYVTSIPGQRKLFCSRNRKYNIFSDYCCFKDASYAHIHTILVQCMRESNQGHDCDDVR